jgi:hypothetical protein
MLMLNRRSLLQRAVALAGATLLSQKVPHSLAEIDHDVVRHFDRAPAMDGVYLMERCTVVPGDPSQNDPEWIRQEGNTIVIRDQVIQIANGVFAIPGRNTSRVIRGCTFDQIALEVEENEQSVFLLDSTFIPAPDATFVFRTVPNPAMNKDFWLVMTDEEAAARRASMSILYQRVTGKPYPGLDDAHA